MSEDTFTYGFNVIPHEKWDDITVAWGARAIYRDRFIDMLADRQQWLNNRVDPDLGHFANQSIAKLRKETNKIPANSKDTMEYTSESPEGTHLYFFRASPMEGSGYMYMAAWSEVKS